jgi:broad specificity phosphatase PhoE
MHAFCYSDACIVRGPLISDIDGKFILQKHWPMVEFQPEMTENDEKWSASERESWGDIRGRVSIFLSRLVQRGEENIVVVSHGVWIETCLRTHRPDALGMRRVHNCDAFACQCISSNDGKFVRLQNVQLIHTSHSPRDHH